MKQTFLFILLLSLSISVLAQVPVRIEREPSVEVPEPSINNNKVGYYQQNQKYGFAFPGNKLQEPIYDQIKGALNGFIVRKGKLYGVANDKGMLVGKIAYDSVSILNNSFLINKNGKYGTISKMGIPLLPVKYHEILGANDLVSLVRNEKGTVRLAFNKTGKTFSKEIESAHLYRNLAIVKVDGKFGVITDKLLVPFEYDSVFYGNSGKVNKGSSNYSGKYDTRDAVNTPVSDIIVVKNKKLGLISNDGTVIYPAENDEVSRVSIKGYYLIKKANRYSIYFVSSKKKTGFDYTQVYADAYGYVMAVKNGKAGILNLKGEEIIPFVYDDNVHIVQYSSIGFEVSQNQKRGIVDFSGNIIIPPAYDKLNTLYSSRFKDFLVVTSGEKSGIVDLKGNTIVPLEFEWAGIENDLFKVVSAEPNRKFGLYDKKGHLVVPAEYKWIKSSDTKKSKVIILQQSENEYNFLNKENEFVFKENVSNYGYVLNEERLLNSLSSTRNYLLYVKNKNGQFGMLDETTGKLVIPMVYDSIIQRFEDSKHIYYAVQKGNRYGLINERNEEVIPIIYNDINVDLVRGDDETRCQIVVAKGKKYGTVNLKNEVQLPFQYTTLECISWLGLYKAKKGGGAYQIINSKNETINKDLFDEVAKFEYFTSDEDLEPNSQTLVFSQGKMRALDAKGNYLTSALAGKEHRGFTTFDELKFALIKAFDSKDDILLKTFVNNIAPSEHILYYLKENIFNKKPIGHLDLTEIRDKYYAALLQFKRRYWQHVYNRSSLTNVTDYTLYRDGYVTNIRTTDHAFGDAKYLEKFLRDAIKINGFWISSCFMKSNF